MNSSNGNYTARGQLAAVGWDDSAGNWAWQMLNYTYLADRKIDHQDYYHARESFNYDPRDFVSSLRHYNQYSDQTFINRTYYRDNRDRIYAWAKEDYTGSSLNSLTVSWRKQEVTAHGSSRLRAQKGRLK